MKISMIIWLTLFLSTGIYEIEEECIQFQETDHFEWLLGDWMRTNDTSGLKTYESWRKHSEMEYHGIGFTMKDGDTIFQEDLKLIEISGKWEYIVSGVNENPTSFELVTMEKNKFIAENLNNEFPKRLTYYMEEKKLMAIASGNEKKIVYEFKELD